VVYPCVVALRCSRCCAGALAGQAGWMRKFVSRLTGLDCGEPNASAMARCLMIYATLIAFFTCSRFSRCPDDVLALLLILFGELGSGRSRPGCSRRAGRGEDEA
jgi:hypothetical protein